MNIASLTRCHLTVVIMLFVLVGCQVAPTTPAVTIAPTESVAATEVTAATLPPQPTDTPVPATVEPTAEPTATIEPEAETDEPGSFSTLLGNEDGANDGLRGIGRFIGASHCTATFITVSDNPNAPAYIITNGHCAQEWSANGVFVDLPATGMTMAFNYFVDTQDSQIVVPANTIVYSTMKARDVAIVELDTTVGDLLEQGIQPFTVAEQALKGEAEITVVGVPTTGLAAEIAFLRQEDCAVSGRADLLEFTWHFYDAHRNDCQDIYGEVLAHRCLCGARIPFLR